MISQPEISWSWIVLAFRERTKNNLRRDISKQHEMEASPAYLSWMTVMGSCDMMGSSIRGGRLNCYLGVYPISRIKHWYWSQHFLLDRVPLTGDGWRRRARRARVKRGRFVKITIANCNPQTPGLSLVKDDDCFNFSLVWDDKENTTRSWAIIVKLMEREEKELMTWIKTIHWETPDSWRE